MSATEVVTRYDVIVHARNRNSDYGVRVTVYADSRQGAANEAVRVAWSGYPDDARVTFRSVTQEVIAIPQITPTPEAETTTTKEISR